MAVDPVEEEQMRAGLPIRFFPDAAAWACWLAENHAGAAGLWLKLAKKGSELHSLSYAEALETALCYGWIDGLKQAFDASAWLQKFTPRTKRSIWSQINRDKATVLIAAGRMQAAGLAEFERARADGRWDAAYAPASRMTVPEDLTAALTANPEAAAFFAALDGASRYAILWRLETAKQAATRARRLEKLVAMLARGEKIYAP